MREKSVYKKINNKEVKTNTAKHAHNACPRLEFNTVVKQRALLTAFDFV